MADVRPPRILVTADAGELGVLVLEKLCERLGPFRIAALLNEHGSSADRLHSLGIDVRIANYDRPESLDTAFLGIDRLLLISPCTLFKRSIYNRNRIEAAARARVKFIAFTSGLPAERSPFRVVDDHLESEEMLRRSGIPHAAVRNGWGEDAYTFAALAGEISRQKRERSYQVAEHENTDKPINGVWSSVSLADALADLLDAGSRVRAPALAFAKLDG